MKFFTFLALLCQKQSRMFLRANQIVVHSVTSKFSFLGIVLSVVFLCSSTVLSAQVEGCGADEIINSKYSEFTENFNASLKRFKESNQTKSVVGDITIPVVVHQVRWSNMAPDDTELAIRNQIDFLNQVFSGNVTPSQQWAGVSAGDTGIRFCLASIDPDGNETSGIKRYNASDDENTNLGNYANLTQVIDHPDMEQWPVSDYLNVWVCNVPTTLYGIATYPNTQGTSAGGVSWEGVIINSEAFGVNQGSGWNYSWKNGGATLVHEVGHYLGLQHIWGPSPGNCTVDDGFEDTPLTAAIGNGCPSDLGIDLNQCGEIHMIENYMSYGYDPCKNLFTAEQSAFMQFQFEPGEARASLLNSLGCDPCNDLNITAEFSASTFQTSNPSLYTYEPINFQDYNFLNGSDEWIIIKNLGTDEPNELVGDGTYSYDEFPLFSRDTLYTILHKVRTKCGDACYISNTCEFYDGDECSEGSREISCSFIPEIISTITPNCVQSVPTNLICYGGRLGTELAWDAVEGATSYQVQFLSAGNNSYGMCCLPSQCPVTTPAQIVSTNSIDAPAELPSCYRWRVRTYCGSNYNTGPWSTIREQYNIACRQKETGGEGGPWGGGIGNINSCPRPWLCRTPEIYPNPSSNEFTIDFRQFSESEVNIEIFDATGKMVHSNSTQQIDKYTWTPALTNQNGIYLIRIKDGSETSMHKVVLQR